MEHICCIDINRAVSAPMQVFKFPLQKEILQLESIWLSGGAGICSQVSGCRGAGKGSRQGGGVCGSCGSHRSAGGVVRAKQTIGCGQRAQGGAGRGPKGMWGALKGVDGATWKRFLCSPPHKIGNAVGKWFYRGEQVCDGKDNYSPDKYFPLLLIIGGAPLLLSHHCLEAN